MTIQRSGFVDDERHANGANDESRAWVIEDVLDAALTTTGAEIAEIFLRENGGSGVSLAGFRGPFREAFNQITHFEEGQGYPGLVVSEGRPLKATDVLHDTRFLRTQVRNLGFQYFLCVPIPGQDRPIGSLDVAWRCGSESVLSQSHCITLARDAERFALLLDRRDRAMNAGSVADDASALEGRLDLRVLGSFEARRGGVPFSLDHFARRRSVTLLKILVTNYGKTVGREELIDMLWPSEAPKDAPELLKIAVHYLRRGVDDPHNAKTDTSFISTEPSGYAFNPASLHRIDALDFEAMAQEGLRFEHQGRWREALVALRAAAEIYGGDYLEDERYSDWCLGRRRQLRELLLDVLVTIARLLCSSGDFEAAIRCHRRILELDPCLEDVHRDLMDVLSRCGKRTQALRQYEECRRALREEFDVSPVLETEMLYRSILGRRSD
jgi:DNA-binding SARP family transcriptional activator